MNHRIVIGAIAALAAVAPAAAQPPAAAEWTAAVQHLPTELPPPGIASSHAQSVVESRITTGRPYSAEATTEFVQVLGDGNRIARKTSVRIFRDTDGRTRREEIGANDATESISIYDPVAQASYVLDPKNRTAHKSDARMIVYTMSGGGRRGGRIESKIAAVPAAEARLDVVPEGGAKRQMTFVGARMSMSADMVAVTETVEAFDSATTESLGQQVIGGVPADGTRTTTVIAAGAIGNQQEIRIVSDQWFSPDLEVLVMTTHSDPRSGDMTYRLSNIIRAEPGPGLFDVPSDYTIKEGHQMHFRRSDVH